MGFVQLITGGWDDASGKKRLGSEVCSCTLGGGEAPKDGRRADLCLPSGYQMGLGEEADWC